MWSYRRWRRDAGPPRACDPGATPSARATAKYRCIDNSGGPSGTREASNGRSVLARRLRAPRPARGIVARNDGKEVRAQAQSPSVIVQPAPRKVVKHRKPRLSSFNSACAKQNALPVWSAVRQENKYDQKENCI